MHVLEARFHPRRKGQSEFVVIGHLVWRRLTRRERPVFQPAAQALPEPILTKLRYFLAVTAPDCFARLQSLRSEFWSFVEIGQDGGEWAGLPGDRR
nr:MetaGeneMark_Unknown Function [uncultured bacterium]